MMGAGGSCLEEEDAEDADEGGETSPSPRRSSSSAEDGYSGDGSCRSRSCSASLNRLMRTR